MAAITMESDMDFAFQLQLLEAINASLSLHHSDSETSSSTVPAPLPPQVSNDDVSGILLSGGQQKELQKFDQEIKDRLISQAEFRKMRDDLHRRLHDQKLAEEIQRMPEDEWEEYGDNYERPYGKKEEEDEEDEEEGSSKSSITNEIFRVYFKGMVETKEVAVDKNEKGCLTTKVFAGIGVAITDSRDQLIVEISKPLSGEEMNKRIAGIKALIEGLNTALLFDLQRVALYCDHFPIYQFVTGKWNPNQRKLAVLMEQVTQLRDKFAYCQPFIANNSDMKLACKLAKEAIVSQIRRPGESSAARKTSYETCLICYEDKDAKMIFSVDGCGHRYCYSCMKRYVEGKLLNGKLPKCPHEGCDSVLNVDGTSKFLTPKLVEIMKERIKEASIPIKEKIYCPIEKCSALMSKSEVLEYSQRLAKEERSAGARLCKECSSSFCINCKVSWHSNMSCSEFKRRFPGLAAEETKLKKLAATNLWRQCKNCNHMIELSSGCYHITCRCGYEFCYICGSEWKNKKPTCTCRIWDEENIVDESSDDEDYDYDYDSGEDFDEDYGVYYL